MLKHSMHCLYPVFLSFHLSHSILLFSFPILHLFPDLLSRLSVFEAVFRSFSRCALEQTWPVRLPGVMLRGQAQSTVSLHQHVCVQLCACVAALPAPQLPSLVGAQHCRQKTMPQTQPFLCSLARGIIQLSDEESANYLKLFILPLSRIFS